MNAESDILQPSELLGVLCLDAVRVKVDINRKLGEGEPGEIQRDQFNCGTLCLKSQRRTTFPGQYASFISASIRKLKEAGVRSVESIQWMQRQDAENEFWDDYASLLAVVRK